MTLRLANHSQIGSNQSDWHVVPAEAGIKAFLLMDEV